MGLILMELSTFLHTFDALSNSVQVSSQVFGSTND